SWLIESETTFPSMDQSWGDALSLSETRLSFAGFQVQSFLGDESTSLGSVEIEIFGAISDEVT
ncbi:MAG: hypothetical protein VW938_07505, partial [Synechococcus sp.]